MSSCNDFFHSNRKDKKVIQTQTFFSVNEKGTKNILKCQRKTDKDWTKKCYNNMFCLRWIVFVGPERFGQWQQQYLVSKRIKRPKSVTAKIYQLWGRQPTLNRSESSFLRSESFFIIFFYVILPRLILCPRERKNVDVAMNFFLIPRFTLNINTFHL